MEGQKAVVIGISGCSSSGKTTLARLLREIFPDTFILHEDDFYKPEEQLPVKDGLLDWDCTQSISIPDMRKALEQIRSSGHLPPDLSSIQDENTVEECPVSSDLIEAMKSKVQVWLQPGRPGHLVFNRVKVRVCLLDGFLLYCPQMTSVMATIDVKLFLLVSREKAKERREARDGYVTTEGFWKDPPGYMDKIVWPNYVNAHAWLFEGGDVEGKLNMRVLAEQDIEAQVDKGLDVDFAATLEWAVATVMQRLENVVLYRK